MAWKPAPCTFPKPQRRAGCVVLDETNSSGLAKGGKPPLVAVLRDDTGGRDAPAIRLAASADGGSTWTIDNASVTLDEGKTPARTHRVVFHKPSGRWLLVIGFAAEPKPKPEPKAKIDPKVDPKVDPKAKTPELIAKAAVYSSKNLRDWEKHPDVELPDAFGLADLFFIPFNKKADDLRLAVATHRNAVKVAEFDGKTMTIPEKATTAQLERSQHVTGMRVVEMADDRRAILAVLRLQFSREGPPPMATLPTELRLVDNDAKAPYFSRTFLREFNALALEKPEPRAQETLKDDENELGSFAPQFEKAKGVYLVEFELTTNNERGRAILKLRGHTIVFDSRSRSLRIGDNFTGTVSFYKTTVRVRVVSDRRSLEVYVGPTSYTVPLNDSGEESENSLTGTATKVTNLNVIPLRPAGDPAPK